MEDIEKTVIETEARSRSNTNRLDRLEESTAAVVKLASSVEQLAQNMDRMAREQEKQGDRLSALEKQPGERWNTMTRTIFTSAVSTVCGGLMGALVALLLGAIS